MAWRIGEAVVRGEIDNSVEGTTTGRIWLLGRDEPLELELNGDCWRDIAGTRMAFRNPSPSPVPLDGLGTRQNGLVGDMTASRRTREPLDEGGGSCARNGGNVAMGWRNSLYLEWFAERDGRVFVELADFEASFGERVWVMDQDAEEAQKLANLQAMRDAMAGVIRRRPDDAPPCGDNEFAWEQRLQESDRLTDAYQEVLEKYRDEPDSENKEAFVMGWDGLLGTLADRAEGRERAPSPWEMEDYSDDGEDWKEEGESVGFLDEKRHPVQEKATEVALRAIDLTRAEELDHPSLEALNGLLMQVAGKLAGVLTLSGYDLEKGLVLATLKRCLHWQNDAVAHCSKLVDETPDEDLRRAYEALRDSIFEVREDIVNLRREIKGN